MDTWNRSDIMDSLTILLVIIGWLIVYFQNRSFQYRKELRASIDIVHNKIDELRDMSIEYHTIENSAAHSLSNRIKSMIKVISSSIIRTPLDDDEIRERVIDLRKKITLENFDTANYQPQRHNSEIILDIYSSCDELKETIETRFYDIYRHNGKKFSCIRNFFK